MFQDNPVLSTITTTVSEGTFNGKKAYRFKSDYTNGIVIIDELKNRSIHKSLLKQMKKERKFINYFRISAKSEANYIRDIKHKLFNHIDDFNWKAILPFLDNFKNNKRINGLSIYLHGIPGSGKTRFSEQIALYLNADIYSVQ